MPLTGEITGGTLSLPDYVMRHLEGSVDTGAFITVPFCYWECPRCGHTEWETEDLSQGKEGEISVANIDLDDMGL